MDVKEEAQALIDGMRKNGDPDVSIIITLQHRLNTLKQLSELSTGTDALSVAMGTLLDAQSVTNLDIFTAALELLGAPPGGGDEGDPEEESSVSEDLNDKPVTVHIIGTSPDIAILRGLMEKNYTATTHVPAFVELEAGHITSHATELLTADAHCKCICIPPIPRFAKDYETFLGAHARANGYKVKSTGAFDEDTITDWPSITGNELIAVLKTALEGRFDDYSPLKDALPQMDQFHMEIRGHGVALMVITTPEGKQEPYELKLELRKLNE